ncbi:hypothetical protein CRE_16615 [Caenorhabditis remanei]|uniref:Uncharacterized protein n=1 Tax=Caenorhabditis remanei TaxID=31234 RepID=E3MAR5_CAERE|nr:hypothetical protein CRE_16615 [Caenorhabditis remanei]
MLDYKGILTNITGFTKTNFYVALRRGGRNSTNTSVTSSGTTSSASTSRQGGQQQERGRDQEKSRRHVRLSSEEARTTTIMGREAREDGIYTEENGAGSPFVVVVSRYNLGDMNVEKEADKKKKKGRKNHELNIPKRDMFAPDFVIQPDEDLPGFTPIVSDFDSDEDPYEAEEENFRRASLTMPPPLMGCNPDIPNEYDPVIGIISIQGVPIPRSRPIDIVPNREPPFHFFGVNGDLQVMLITERSHKYEYNFRMYDVFKERVRTKGKKQMFTMMENMAMALTCGQMCGRLVPVQMMDESLFYYDYETVTFLSKEELVNLLILCEPDDIENNSVAASYPDMFYRENPEHKLERNKFYQHLMERSKIYLRRTDYMVKMNHQDFTVPFVDTVDTEQNQRLTIERQIKDNKLKDIKKLDELIESISQNLEEAERLQGLDFVRRSTLALYDARVVIPSVN